MLFPWLGDDSRKHYFRVAGARRAEALGRGDGPADAGADIPDTRGGRQDQKGDGSCKGVARQSLWRTPGGGWSPGYVHTDGV